MVDEGVCGKKGKMNMFLPTVLYFSLCLFNYFDAHEMPNFPSEPEAQFEKKVTQAHSASLRKQPTFLVVAT